MKIQVETKGLLAALSAVSAAANKSPLMPQLNCVKISKAHDGLLLRCISQDAEAGVLIPAEIDVDVDDFSVNAELFRKLIETLSGEQTEIIVDEGFIQVSSAGFSGKVFTQNGPMVWDGSDESEDTVKLSAEKLRLALGFVRVSVAKSSERTAFNSICLFFGSEGQIQAWSTDGHRASAWRDGDMKEPVVNALLNRASVKALSGWLGKSEGSVTVGKMGETLVFRIKSDWLRIPLQSGRFPSLRAAIPEEDSAARFWVERQTLLEAIRRIALMSDSDTRKIELSVGNETLAITGHDKDSGSASESLSVTEASRAIGCPADVAVNSKYLLEALRAFSADRVVVDVYSKEKPVIIQPLAGYGDADEELAIIMPLYG